MPKASRRFVLTAVAFAVTSVALVGAGQAVAAGGDAPPSVNEYVEALPTAQGNHPTGYVKVKQKALTRNEKKAVASQASGVQKALKAVASSTAFGAPQSSSGDAKTATEASPSHRSKTGTAVTSASSALRDSSASSTPVVLIVLIAVGVAAAAAALIMRSRSHRLG